MLFRSLIKQDDDGVFVTDNSTGKSRMVVTYKKIIEETGIDMSHYGEGDFYGFHTKWNSKSNRIMLVLRYKPKVGNILPALITLKPDGTDIHVAIPASEWADNGGNHPNWAPDGEHIIMNLNYQDKGWRYIKANYDGTNIKYLTEVPASHGHPSLHKSGKFILTDAYPTEKMAYGDGTAPLWLINCKTSVKPTLVRIDAVTKIFRDQNTFRAGAMRVDLHPAWDHSFRYVAFNGVWNGSRHVFITDLSKFL